MSKHTPGPWEKRETIDVSTDDEIQEWAVTIGAPAHMETALAFGSTPDEAEANARLIAAAPDLLEACQSAYEQMHGLIRRLSDAGLYGLADDLYPGKNPTTLTMLRNVIAAATGEQS